MTPAALGVVPAAASAASATVKGTIAGPGLPDAGEGVAGVRAVNAETGVVGAADYTGGKRDRWRLGLSPGPYALAAVAVPFGGGRFVDRLVAFVDARSGDTETLKLRLKPKRRNRAEGARPRVTARVGDGFGDVSVDYPAIWIKHFDVQAQDADLGVMSKGIADMLTSDLSAAVGQPDCPGAIVERDHIQDVINEQKLSQLPGFDPSTAVRRGRLIRDNASVTGTIAESGGHVTLTATYTDRRRSPARTRTVSVQGPGEDLFDLEQQLAQKLIAVICSDGLPDQYAGTFSGASVTSETTTSWNGTVTWQRLKPPDPRGADCDGRGVACYEITGGSLTWRVSSSPGAECINQSSAKTVSLPGPGGPGVLYVDASGSETPGYSGGFGVPDTNTGTSQCDPSDPPQDEIWFLNDCCLATHPGTPWGDYGENGGLNLRGTRTSDAGPSYSVTRTWDFTGQ
ncbi:MAG: hypothetical protein QOI10_446 [Solirubrobacterales bacterium]|jgi:hypothetical protein|nr:hypothetical protein [Solirubrobacterales bacterium]